MKANSLRSKLPALCFSLLLGPGTTLFAAKEIESKITTVTVFADRAQVTRTASVKAAEKTEQFTFSGLPGWIDEGSVRLATEPGAAEVVDVEIKRHFLSKATDAEVVAATKAVQEISDKLAVLDDEKKVLDAQTAHIESIRTFALSKLPRDAAARPIRTQEYTEFITFLSDQQTQNAKNRRLVERKRRDLQPELNARQKKLDALQSRSQLQECSVTVTLARGKDAKGKLPLELTYLVPGATWNPAHDLRAAPGAKEVSLSSFAVIRQSTGEDWSDADIILSTQSPTEAVRIPELEALLVGGGRKAPNMAAQQTQTFEVANDFYLSNNGAWFANQEEDYQREAIGNMDALMSCVAMAKDTFTTLQDRGTTAQFNASGRQAIRTDGKPVRVGIGDVKLDASQRLVAAPEVSLNAVRSVELTNTGGQPLLPGRVSLYVDGAFLGNTEIDFVARSEPFSLFLGFADAVKLSRQLDRQRSELSRWGSGTRMQVSFVVSAENLSDKPATVQLGDRIPVSQSDDVRVRNVRITPAAIKPNDEGLLKWDVKLAAGEKKEFRIEYALEYPTALAQRGEDQKGGNQQQQQAMPSAPALEQQIRDLEAKF